MNHRNVIDRLRIFAQFVGFATILLLAVYGGFAVFQNAPAALASLAAQDTNGENASDAPVEASDAEAIEKYVDFIRFEKSFAYQGALRNPDGSLVADGTYRMTFRIFTDPVDGACLYGEVNEAVVVRGGQFGVVIGDHGANTVPNCPTGDDNVMGAIFRPLDGSLFISMAVGDDPELLPRQRLHSVPWASRAHEANEAELADEATTAERLTAGNKTIAGSLRVDSTIEAEYITVTGNNTDKDDVGSTNYTRPIEIYRYNDLKDGNEKQVRKKSGWWCSVGAWQARYDQNEGADWTHNGIWTFVKNVGGVDYWYVHWNFVSENGRNEDPDVDVICYHNRITHYMDENLVSEPPD